MRIPSPLAFLVSAAAFTTTAVPSIAQAPEADPAARFRAVADEYVAAVSAQFPETAESLGDSRSPERWTDISPASLRAWEAREDAFLARMREIDGGALYGTPEWVAFGMMREQLESSRGTRACRSELWGVSQLNGIHLEASRAVGQQRVGTPEHRERALARFRAFPRYLDQEIANLREGLAAGYTAPREAVSRVVQQLDAMIPADIAQSGFHSPAQRDSSPEFRAAWAEVMRSAVYPAIAKYRDFLRDEYLPRARAEPGLHALPNGRECYRAMVRASTSLDLDPAEIPATARRARAEIEAELRPIARRLTGTDDLAAARRMLRSDPRFVWKSREEMHQATVAAAKSIEELMPRAFSRIPATPLVVEAGPAHEERSMPGAWYQQAPLDRSRPAVFFINLFGAEQKPRMDLGNTVAHEGMPGHHLQIAWAQELPAPHPVTRLLRTGAFVEGWGMYGERVAYEIGAMGDDLQRAGVLVHLADALVALEVDPGIHAGGWTREQAVDSMMSISGRSRQAAELYADRHAATPSQTVTYMTGYLELMRLRERARAELGPRFDVREFHDRVLGHGAITLPMLRETIDRWIAEKKRA
ncbi:MAG TPA: DUF885 domain-containing protein [Longimicrobium sp.]|nr:DUF885 domain-containing protein [Longimicrobium sp.]